MQKFTIITAVCLFYYTTMAQEQKAILLLAFNIDQYNESINLPKGQVHFPILDHTWDVYQKNLRIHFRLESPVPLCTEYPPVILQSLYLSPLFSEQCECLHWQLVPASQ